jgi:hypothetical protein
VNYRVVYDVLDDVPIPAREEGLIFLGAALFWTILWVVLTRCIRARSPGKGPPVRAGVVIGGLFICLGLVTVVRGTYPMFVDQKRCKEWARAGDFLTEEGRITAFVRESGRNPPTHFQVGAVRFTYRGSATRTGGFRGTFTDPGARDLRLRDGLAVRIAHRDGRILRIEVAD